MSDPTPTQTLQGDMAEAVASATAEDVIEDVVEDATETDLSPLRVASRAFVPSTREVDEGLAEYTFEPLPPPEREPRRKLGAWLRETLVGYNPRTLAGDGPMRPIVLLFVVLMFSGWDDAAFAVMLPEIRNDFGFDIGFVLVITSIVALGTELFAPFTGFLADRFHRVRMMGIGSLIANGSSVMTGLSGSLPILTGTRFTAGLGQAVVQPAAVPLITDWYPMEKRARVLAFIFTGFLCGIFLGPPVAGAVGDRFGWRIAVSALGLVAVAASIAIFTLKEPIRGELDRRALGADDEAARTPQKSVSWSEGWRAASKVATLRRVWIATPFLTAGTTVVNGLTQIYYADEFGVSATWRGAIGGLTGFCAVLGLVLAGPISDRLLAHKPGRVFTLFGILLTLNATSVAVMAVSPFLLLSMLVSLPLVIGAGLILPSQLTVVSMVVPARIRGFGIQTIAPWRVMGLVLIFAIGAFAASGSARGPLLMLAPIYLIGALIMSTAGSGVERDMRAATAAAMADEAARLAREAGGNKMIICRDVDVTYDGTQVLFNVDFDVEEGELVALLGTNGAGKSTLLRAIAGVQEASNGAIFLDGLDITHRPPHQNAQGGIVFMPGGRAVFPSLTVEENLRAAAWMYREDEEYVRQRTEEILAFFPILRDRLHQQAGSMSGGEQQMLALGQAFLMKPRLLMIDELSLGLAPNIVEQLLDIVRRVNEQGTTIILVEQSANIALTVARRAVFMEKGEIRFDGSTEELLGRGDLLRSVFLAGAGGGGGGGGYIPSGSALRRGGRIQEPERVLDVSGVSVRYGGHQALRGAGVTVDTSEVVGIIGPNGAGKTTLFDVISGYVTPDAGTVIVAGQDVAGMSPDARARLGLARSFQNARLFPALTVRENIAVALEQRLASRSILAAATWMPVVRRSERRATRRVDYLLDLLNLEAFATKFVNELSTGSRRMVDMACVMATEPKVLLLDEPSSGLAQAEVEVLGPVVRRMARETGCGVLVIEHDMPLIQALSDRLIAMELGAPILEGKPSDVVADERVVSAYLGASEAVIGRSGSALAEALVVAGVTAKAPTRSGDAASSGARPKAPTADTDGPAATKTRPPRKRNRR